MKRVLLQLLLVLPSLLILAFPSAPAYAACAQGNSTPTGQVLQGAGATGGDCTGAAVPNLVASITRILSIVVGIAAVIVVIYAGLKYITAGGDTNKIAAAKHTLIYALIGLAVAALAQFLVHYTLNTTRQAVDCASTPGAAQCQTH